MLQLNQTRNRLPNLDVVKCLAGVEAYHPATIRKSKPLVDCSTEELQQMLQQVQ